jgi:hypothetical protein
MKRPLPVDARRFTLALFAFYALLFASFIRLWRDLADPNEIVRRRKRNVILRNAITLNLY